MPVKMIGVLVLLGLVALNDAFPSMEVPFEESMPRIVGGSEAKIGEFPWQLMLYRDGSFVCGAVLVNNTRAITAAHCLSAGYQYSIRAGLHKASDVSGTILRDVGWTKHSGYDENAPGYPNDIAMLRWTEPIEFTPTIKPLRIAYDGEGDFSGQQCVISGWGRLRGGSDGPLPDVLQFVVMGVITNTDCSVRWIFNPSARINDGHVCVYEKDKSACNGDSGGPLVCVGTDGGNALVGIASWTASSCNGAYPTVYTRVNQFWDFIGEQM